MAGNPRTLFRDRLLGNLNQNLLPLLQELADDGQIAGLGGLAAAIVAAAAIVSVPTASPARVLPLAAGRLTRRGRSSRRPLESCSDSLGLFVVILFLFDLALLLIDLRPRSSGRSVPLNSLVDMFIANQVIDLSARHGPLVKSFLFHILEVVIVCAMS